MDRRIFILSAAAFAAGCTRNAESVASPAGAVDAISANAALGIQLYSVRNLMAEDVQGTLNLISGVGFSEVEFAGYFDYSPEEMRAMLDAAGLAAPSAHVGYDLFAQDSSAAIGHAVAMGHKYLVIPYLADHLRALDDYRRHGENFNLWGEQCKAAGLQLAYHNHDFEFHETDGEIPYDLLLSETDADLVNMQLDLAWAHAANVDPIAYFKAWPGRFPSLHIKDFNAEAGESDIGDGDVPFESIFEYLELAGVRHGFVERDNSTDIHHSIKHNFDAIMPLWSASALDTA